MSLTIRTQFEIAAPPDIAWEVLTDIERAAPCFPGAELAGRNPDGTYNGAFNVRLGPMAFRFDGKFGFGKLDRSAGEALVQASGRDVKGRGGAKANVQVYLQETAGGTAVELTSQVDLSGALAQYGRGAGMIEALSQQLVNQFARNLGREVERVRASRAAVEVPGQPDVAQPNPAPSTPPAPDAVPSLNAGRLVWLTFVATVRKWFSALLGRSDRKSI